MEQPASPPPAEGNVDTFGVVASTICAIHCAICGLLPFLFVGLGLGFLLSHEVEWALTLGAIAFATVALFQGWRQHHSLLPVGFFLMGIVGLLTSRGIEMTSGHHHDEHHHSDKHADEHDEHHDEHNEHHDEHDHENATHTEEKAVASHNEEEHGDVHHHDDESAHSLGGVIGLSGGFLLVFGHIFNIRANRQCREKCCDDPVSET